MVMLILETFVLLLISGLLGTALGHLLAEAYGSDLVTDRPWLRDRAPLAPPPVLPTAPVLLDDAERARLAAALEPTAPARVPTVPAPAPLATAPAAVEPTPDVAPAIDAADAARAAEADAHGARPLGLSAPRAGGGDDLKRIKGIGKQNEARLNALGIWHFDQIAAWTPDNIRWAGSFLAFVGRIEREDWVGQAATLAAGGTTEFAARVDAGEVPTSSA